MALSGDSRSMKHRGIREMKKYLDHRVMPLLRFEGESLLESHRRRRVAERSRERMARRVLESVGIDQGDIEQRHRREFATMQRHARAQHKKVIAFAKQRARANRARIAALIPRWNEPPSPIDDPLLVFLPSAVDVQHLVIGPISVGGAVDASWRNLVSSAGVPGQNRVTGQGSLSAGRTQFGSLSLLTTWFFTWRSSRVGFLKASAWAQADLTYLLMARPVCAGQNSSAGVRAEAWLSVGQYSPQIQFSAATSTISLLDQKVSRSGVGDPTQPDRITASPAASEFLTLGPAPTPITSGVDVVCGLSIRLEINAADGVAIASFEPPLQLGAPVVILNIE